jgi:hypothetical protein
MVLCAAGFAAFPACNHDLKTATQGLKIQEAASVADVANTEEPAPEAPEPYPPGRWRLAAPAELGEVILWVSHILIRHDQVTEPRMSFNLTSWEADLPQARRTRREALQLAEKIAKQARESGDFAKQARELSEDPSTREMAGSLGGISAGQLWSWPEALDALATLQVGDVSRVVESPFGYHVFHRRAPVPLEEVTGSHILIGYTQAPWIEVVARGQSPERSRDEARALANQIFEQARSRPEAFGGLVKQYSEHRDAARAGDFGTWSTREPTPYPREIETLTQLKVGEVAAPIDTLFGFQIIQRTENRPRQKYAMTKLQLRFDPDLPAAAPGSRAAVLQQANDLADSLHGDASRFETWQEEHCCSSLEGVVEGRSIPELEEALARLRPGEFTRHAIAGHLEYLIPRRLELSALPQRPAPRFELPTPQVPDILYYMSHGPKLAEEQLREIAERATAELHLTPDTEREFLKLHDLAGQLAPLSVSQRLDLLQQRDAELKQLLGPRTYGTYSAIVSGHFEQRLLRL